MEMALMAKKFKSEIEDRDRETEILDKIRRNATGLINGPFIEKLYMEILSESKNLQQQDYRLIAFQGEHGAFGEVASMDWDSSLITIACPEFAELFEGVKSGLYNYGIVPVENRLGGVVGQVNQLFIQSDVYVVGAIELPIHLCLLVLPETDHREIRVVYSHSQALAQCRQFLTRNKLEPVQYYGTAGAAKMLAETTPKASAVIASKLSAELYHLEIIKEDIEDSNRNITRFLVISNRENREGGDKCSIVFSTAHQAGTLFKVLEVFAKTNINLTRIESMPTHSGDYVFFVDFLGSNEDEDVIKALKVAEEFTTSFRLMGCYNEMKVE
jgi:prephenate dehydratase/chorismate mutase/prephenate dehydratase